jgi:hypothetical protein
MNPSRSLKALVLAVIVAAVLAAPAPSFAQLWRLEPDISFSTFVIGWEPLDTTISAVSLIGARTGGYLKVGYGFALDRDYYLLIPERECAVKAYAGVDWVTGAATSFSPGGASESGGPARNLARGYVNLGIDQILLGDRRISNSWLMLSLWDVSRYVMPAAAPQEAAAPEAFFTHSPGVGLSFNLGRKLPFWELASLSGGLGATLEAGHSPSRGVWSFVMAKADLGLKFPILGKYLYADAGASLDALLANLLTAAPVPSWAYVDYADAASLSGQADVKCRVIEFNVFVPMALELGLGARAAATAADLSTLDPLAVKPVLHAFVDWAIDLAPVTGLRLRAGVEYDPQTGAFSPLLVIAD